MNDGNYAGRVCGKGSVCPAALLSEFVDVCLTSVNARWDARRGRFL